MMLNKKPRRRFKAIVWIKKEKDKKDPLYPKKILNYKEKSFKDLNTNPHYFQHQYGLGFTFNGGKKPRYA